MLIVDSVATEDCAECLGDAVVCESFCDTVFESIPMETEKGAYNAE